MELALDHAITSIAFPAISSGVYRFPIDRAARIAIQTVADAPGIEQAVFACFGPDSMAAHEIALRELKA